MASTTKLYGTKMISPVQHIFSQFQRYNPHLNQIETHIYSGTDKYTTHNIVVYTLKGTLESTHQPTIDVKA